MTILPRSLHVSSRASDAAPARLLCPITLQQMVLEITGIKGAAHGFAHQVIIGQETALAMHMLTQPTQQARKLPLADSLWNTLDLCVGGEE